MIFYGLRYRFDFSARPGLVAGGDRVASAGHPPRSPGLAHGGRAHGAAGCAAGPSAGGAAGCAAGDLGWLEITPKTSRKGRIFNVQPVVQLDVQLAVWKRWKAFDVDE